MESKGKSAGPRDVAVIVCAILVFALPSLAEMGDAETEALLSTLAPWARAGHKTLFGVSRIGDLNRIDVALNLEPRGDRINGRATISFRNTSHATLDEFVLRLWPNSAGAGRLMKLTYVGTSAGPSAYTYRTDSAVSVPLPAKARPGDVMWVETEFTAEVPRMGQEQTNLYAQAVEQLFRMAGGGTGKPAAQDYGVFATGEGIYNLGGFYPAPAYLGGNGWEADESNGLGDFSFGPPTNFFVSVATPAGYAVATPGRTLKTDETADGREVRYIVACGVRDFVIEASRSFARKSDTAEGVAITSYHLTGDSAAGAKVLAVAKDAFTFYSRKFGAYPYADLKVVEAPLTGGAGGVEFPGLVTIASMFMHEHRRGSGGPEEFFQLLSAGAALGDMLDFIVAHEVAHQWWNAVVGSNPRANPWVDEALASYTAYLYFDEVFGEARGRHLLETQLKLNYQMMRLFGGRDRPVETAAGAYDSMLDYAGIVYGKAPMFHHALRALIGAKAYTETCREYARRHAFKTAAPAAFTQVAGDLNPSYKDRIDALYKRWMKDTHGDEDIGQPDMARLVEIVTGQQIDGSMREFMEELFPMMKRYR